MFNKKRFLVLTLVLLMIPISAAQAGGGGQIFTLVDGYVDADISNGQDFLVNLLVPFIIIFASTRFMVAGAANRVLGRERSSSHSGGGMGGYMMKTGKSMSTWVAAATALTAVWQFGSIITMLTLIFVVIGLGWGLLQSFYFTASSATSGARDLASDVSSSSGGSGVSADQVRDIVGSQIDKIMSEEQNIDDEEKDEKKKEDQTEKEEEQGANPEQVEEEIEAEEAELMDIVNKIETVEGQIETVEDEVRELEEEEISEMRNEYQRIEGIDQFEDRFLDQVDKLYKNAEEGGMTPEEFNEVEEHFGEQIQFIQELNMHLEEEKQVHEATEELINQLKRLKNKVIPHTEEEIQRAETLLEELEDEEQKAETLAQKYGSRDIFENIENDERETAEIEQEIRNQTMQRMNELKTRLDDEIEKLKELRRYDEEEWAKIVNTINKLNRVEEDSKGLFSSIKDKIGEDQSEEFWNRISTMNEQIEEIESKARQFSSEHQAEV